MVVDKIILRGQEYNKLYQGDNLLYEVGGGMYKNCLSFTAVDGDITINLDSRASNTECRYPLIQYSKDNGNTWTEWRRYVQTSTTYYYVYDTINLENGTKILFKASSGIGSSMPASDTYSYSTFLFGGSGLVSADGDITSLYNDGIGGNYGFIDSGCFNRMFLGQSKLIKAPRLASTTYIGNYMYYGMFAGCSGLTSIPYLSCPYLTDSCFDRMFQDCTGLKSIKLPNWVFCWEGAKSYTGRYECEWMFKGCTGLTSVEMGNITGTINTLHMWFMFEDCTSLNYVKDLNTEIQGDGETMIRAQWLKNVSPNGTFVKKSGVNWYTVTGTSGIPKGWTVIEE